MSQDRKEYRVRLGRYDRQESDRQVAVLTLSGFFGDWGKLVDRRENKDMKGSLALWIVAGFLVGCQTSNFAKSSSPATIQEEWVRHTPTRWEGTEVFAVRNIEFGYERGGGKHDALVVDPGPTKIMVWYYAHAGGLMDRMFDQTDPVSLVADLAPNGHYKIHSELAESTARFQLVDLQTGQIIATSADVPLVVRDSPLQSAKPGTAVPVFIPVHR